MRTMLPRYGRATLIAVSFATIFCAPSFSRDVMSRSVECDRDDDDDHLGDAMERVHKGRRSPYRKIRSELEAPMPNFATLGEQLPALLKMSDLLKRSRNDDVRGSADSYAAAVRDLATAVQKLQLAPARAAFQAIGNSCGDCHYRGGPGGKLD